MRALQSVNLGDILFIVTKGAVGLSTSSVAYVKTAAENRHAIISLVVCEKEMMRRLEMDIPDYWTKAASIPNVR
jgi:hypothetical protein